MAGVGLRAGGSVSGFMLRSMASTFYNSQSSAIARQALQRAAMPASVGLVRNYSQPREQHFVVSEFGLLSDFVPRPWSKRPFLLSKAGLVETKNHMVERVREVFSLLSVKYYLSGWKSAEFAAQAEELYGAMNEAFAQGDLKALDSICMTTMYASLKTDIKRRKNNFEWRKVSTVTPPRTVHIRLGRLTSDVSVAQVVVRIDQQQAAIPLSRRSGSVSGAAKAALEKPVHVVEYVVFQRVVSDKNSPWSIYGKMKVPEWDLPSDIKSD
ncbi:hypothetical protein H4R99_002382 [Coemansia sp. RSA 1722]|nr:hypothetical protein LPJ57_004062 [Coemansia sp. RSA 486]KAJ2235232.1 hypothetical protein IWW45_002763 [Coemansia sp. RSA 485]KAJ2603378.1 hypothetical protein H4R99_002382 [Coemansia sp. RSA 1722]